MIKIKNVRHLILSVSFPANNTQILYSVNRPEVLAVLGCNTQLPLELQHLV
jgi:hypothetical protein